ncbi:MAG: hypothetical protein WKG32_16920 [Gemmatimonadaceae bacterium]
MLPVAPVRVERLGRVGTGAHTFGLRDLLGPDERPSRQVGAAEGYERPGVRPRDVADVNGLGGQLVELL